MGGVKAYPLKFEPIYKQRIWGGTDFLAVHTDKFN